MKLPSTPSFRLDDKRALVTGGSRGIGLAAAVALAEAGAEVTIAARTRTDIEAVAGAMRDAGLKARSLVLDVADYGKVATVLEKQEPFDILVNSAGTARHGPALEINEADYRAVIDVNLGAALFLAKAVAGRLVAAGRPGSIITISSQMGHVGGPNRTVYCASKFAVEGMTKAMAIELGPHDIRINTICPTFIETELTEKALADADFRAWVLSKIKLGRMGKPEDIMGPVQFLASDASAMVTGTSLLVDGGWTAE
ncbi:SDR family NAD(P)-dependent oxidoreductase [Cucumibacter marinus]|uniref:SDR family NAD(P)-dependent oxidoreductase n=1 Tax=Cucumibacter marinus TaxID=1121252 RepID=UPI000422ED74|nr:SDR family oxidoreductase [Cucumibacter marinus]